MKTYAEMEVLAPRIRNLGTRLVTRVSEDLKGLIKKSHLL